MGDKMGDKTREETRQDRRQDKMEDKTRLDKTRRGQSKLELSISKDISMRSRYISGRVKIVMQ